MKAAIARFGAHLAQRWPAALRSTDAPHATAFLAGAILIVALATVCYWPALNGGFIWDDSPLLTESNLIKAPDGLLRFWTNEAIDYWPVSNSTLWIEWCCWGLRPTGYHVTNLSLHIAAAVLIWVNLRKLNVGGALFAALLFTVHPVNVESVAWIAQRKGLLALVFALISIYCYLRQPQEPCAPTERDGRIIARTSLWYYLSLLAFLLAMLSKGSVAVLPPVLLSMDWWRRGRVGKDDWVRAIPFFLIAAALTIVNIVSQSRNAGETIRDAGLAERAAAAGAVLWFYLSKALLPIKLVFVYPQWHVETRDVRWWLPLVAALTLTIMLWRRRGRSCCRALLMAWGFFCLALAPVLGLTDVFFMMYSLVADHYQYMAVIAVVALAAAGWGTWYRYSNGVSWLGCIVSAAVVLLLFSIETRQQSALYTSAEAIYRATIEDNPGCWVVHNNLGLIDMKSGDTDAAIEHYRHALQTRDFIEARNNLGVALLKLGRFDEAISQYESALRMDANSVETLVNLANALERADRLPEAIGAFHKALQLAPGSAEAHNNVSKSLFRMGQVEQAIDHCYEAIRLKPDYADAYNNLGVILLQTGRAQDAIQPLGQAVALKSDYADACYNLGTALAKTGHAEQAIERFQQALRIEPNYFRAHNNLAALLIQSGHWQEAMEHCQAALQQDPDNVRAMNNLGLALMVAGRHDEAIGHFRRALELSPNYTEAQFNLALAYAQLHRAEEAIAAARKALDVARSKNEVETARQIEAWLTTHTSAESQH